MSIFVEMKRRKVLKAAFVYVVMAWLLLQIIDVVAPILDLPNWVAKLIFFLLLGGLPVTLILAWQFDLTSLGIYREKPLQTSGADATFVRTEADVKSVINCISCLWVVLVGTGLSVGAAGVIHLHESRVVEHQFDLVAQEIAHEVSHLLESDNEALQTLGALFIGEQEPDLPTFTYLSEKVIAKRDELKAIEWVPLVRDAERASFVAKMNEIYPGFKIKAFDGGGKEQVETQRDKYFPVSYTVPKVSNEAAIGFDLNSNPERSMALHEAIGAGTTRQSRPIKLVQSGKAGFLLFNPVFRGDELPVSRDGRRDRLRGFTLGVVDIEKLLLTAVAKTPGASNFLGSIALFEDEWVSDQPVVTVDTSLGAELSVSTQPVAVVDAGFGLTWLVELQPTRAMVREQYSSEHYIVGGVGVLLSIICAVIMSAIATSREMPDEASELLGSRNDNSRQALLEAVPRQGELAASKNPFEERDWMPSRWRTS